MQTFHQHHLRNLCIVLTLVFYSFGAQARDHLITDYGAKGDAQTLSSVAIQKAIDQAFIEGGGRVIVPKGKFLTGTFEMKSNVELHLVKGSILLGSTNINDYYFTSNKLPTFHWKALILAGGEDHISITGKGTIDGQGTELALNIDSLFYAGQLDSTLYQFKERRPKAHVRPQLIQFTKCTDVLVQGITIRNGSSWVQCYDLCNRLILDDLTIQSVAYWNNDGIDVIDSKNVRITNCFVNASDDGICIKSYNRYHGLQVKCDSIYIGHCTVRSSASAIKLGTSSFGGFTNIIIEDIDVFDTYRSAIAIESWESAVIENVLVQRVKAKNTGNALFIRHSIRDIYRDREPGRLRNVVIRDLKANIPFIQPDINYDLRGPTLPFFHNVFPASITGSPGLLVENVTLENIKITYPGKGSKIYAHSPVSRLDEIPENTGDYPEFSMFGELPAWAFYVRHANNLTFKNVSVKIREKDYRPAFVFDDMDNLHLENIKVKGDKRKTPFVFHNVRSKRVTNCLSY